MCPREQKHQLTDFASVFQLEEKAKHCRDVEEERSAWEEKVRMLDRQRREMELRVKKTQNSVADHVAQLSKQV